MRPNWSRRDALQVGGLALTALAGCVGSSETSSTHVTVESVTHTPAFVAWNSPDSIGTYGDRDEQFLLITVASNQTPTSGGTSMPGRDAFELATDDASFSLTPPSEIAYAGGEIGVGEGMKPVSENFILFRVPNPLETSEVTMQWPGGEHTFDEQVTRKLTRPPATFAVEFPAHDAENRETGTVTLAVENEGDVRETFVGALNRRGPRIASTPVTGLSFDVEAGEQKQWTHSYTAGFGSPDEDAETTFFLQWRGDIQYVTV